MGSGITKFTDSEYDLIESFICSNTRVTYKEQYLNDTLAAYEAYGKPFSEISVFDWKCVAMRWTNDKIRIMFQLSIGDTVNVGMSYSTNDVAPE